MGMSTHVVGIKLPDDKWKDMKRIWDECESMDICPPKEVEDYFDGEPPDEKGVIVDIPSVHWTDEMADGYEIHVEQIPKDVTIIRFYNCW